ncbi:MAG: hypothetical protein QM681_09865 [Novosphingobium sp.]
MGSHHLQVRPWLLWILRGLANWSAKAGFQIAGDGQEGAAGSVRRTWRQSHEERRSDQTLQFGDAGGGGAGSHAAAPRLA